MIWKLIGMLVITFGKASKLHSKLKMHSFSQEPNEKIDQLVEVIRNLRQEAMSTKASDQLNPETKERHMKLRLNQLEAVSQLQALRVRNKYLDIYGEDAHIVSISSIVDNLSKAYEKK